MQFDWHERQTVGTDVATKSGHRAKAVKCHNEVNDDNRNEKEAELYGRLQARCSVAGSRTRHDSSEAARDLGLHYNMLRKWVKQYQEEPLS